MAGWRGNWGGGLWTALILLLALALAVALLGWLSHRPLPPRAAEPAAPPRPTGDSPLALALAAAAAQHPGLSGFMPLADGRDAFVARAALARVATRRIDVQYYIWHPDTSGMLLLQALLQAAERGVQVRLLLDDNNTGGMDPLLRALDAHPQIAVRLFNPFMQRRLRPLAYLSDFPRLNRRMHNKSYTVDGAASVVGGRNVGDEYFGAGEGVLFADLDVLATGPVVAEVERDFERYWRSEAAYPLAAIVPDAAAAPALGTAPATDAATQSYLRALEQSALLARLREGQPPALVWAPAQLLSDAPSKAFGQAKGDQLLLGQLQQTLGSAQRELTLVSPYFVPTRDGTDRLTALAQRGVDVAVLTNALAATDVAAVHAGYAAYRLDLLRAGVRIYELKHGATVEATGHGGLTGSSGASLHAKTFQVDGRQLFVGSFNMDPRSAALNTEMGVLIACPELAAQLPASLASHAPARSYAVTLEGGALRWTTVEQGQTVVYDHEPHASIWRRATVWVLAKLPIEWLL